MINIFLKYVKKQKKKNKRVNCLWNETLEFKTCLVSQLFKPEHSISSLNNLLLFGTRPWCFSSRRYVITSSWRLCADRSSDPSPVPRDGSASSLPQQPTTGCARATTAWPRACAWTSSGLEVCGPNATSRRQFTTAPLWTRSSHCQVWPRPLYLIWTWFSIWDKDLLLK